jgi:hypothetical protein
MAALARSAGLSLALLSLLALPALADDCEGRGCSCAPMYGRRLSRFDQAVACLYLGGQKAVFYPNVDEYAVLEIKGISPRSTNGTSGSELWLAVEGQGTTGQNEALQWVDHTKRWLYDGKVSPFFTAIVHMNRGKVDRIQWDSGCATCSPANKNVCVPDGSPVRCSLDEYPENQCSDCAQPFDECSVAEQCVPRVYVAWLGTDSSGSPCTSASKVISRFRGSSVRGLYDSGGQATVTLTPVNKEPIPQSVGGGEESS